MIAQLKLFDDTEYVKLPETVRSAEEKISDITKVTDTQLHMEFSWEKDPVQQESVSEVNVENIHVPENVSSVQENVSDVVKEDGENTLMRRILRERDNKDNFESMTQEMTKYGFTKLWLFNRFFKKFLLKVYGKLPPHILYKWEKETLSYDESRQVVGILTQSFADCNTPLELQHPFRQKRFEHMRRVYINQFYSLFMPQERVYYTNRKKWSILFDKKKYKEALPLYRRVLDIHPDDQTIKKRVEYITAILK